MLLSFPDSNKSTRFGPNIDTIRVCLFVPFPPGSDGSPLPPEAQRSIASRPTPNFNEVLFVLTPPSSSTLKMLCFQDPHHSQKSKNLEFGRLRACRCAHRSAALIRRPKVWKIWSWRISGRPCHPVWPCHMTLDYFIECKVVQCRKQGCLF